MNNDNKFHPVTVKRASEEIFDQIRGLISRGEIRPGDRLPSERSMMDMFQRSRPTIREALRMLERSGYIRTIPGSNGAIVLEPDEHFVQQSMEDALQFGQISLREMSEYRTISETATVKWAAERCENEDIEIMQGIISDMESCIDDYRHFVQLDPKFHGAIANAAKNSVSYAMNESLSKLNRAFALTKLETASEAERRSMCERIHEMHVKIFTAIKGRNVKRAMAAMQEHLSAFEQDLQDSGNP